MIPFRYPREGETPENHEREREAYREAYGLTFRQEMDIYARDGMASNIQANRAGRRTIGQPFDPDGFVYSWELGEPRGAADPGQVSPGTREFLERMEADRRPIRPIRSASESSFHSDEFDFEKEQGLDGETKQDDNKDEAREEEQEDQEDQQKSTTDLFERPPTTEMELQLEGKETLNKGKDKVKPEEYENKQPSTINSSDRPRIDVNEDTQYPDGPKRRRSHDEDEESSEKRQKIGEKSWEDMTLEEFEEFIVDWPHIA